MAGAAAVAEGERLRYEVDDDLIRRAVELADVNALRIALYQATRDPELERALPQPLSRVAGANGSNLVVALSPEDADLVRRKAIEFLSGPVEGFRPVVPDDTELRRLMELLRNEPLTEDVFHYGRDVLAFDEFPRAARWSDGSGTVPEGFTVAVIGAGVSGVAAAIQLERLGIPYTVYERQPDLGGTWRRNTYPDARVDTTNFMYQYSFEKNYPWPEYFSRQQAVRAYLAHVAEKHGVTSRFRFGVDVTDAKYDEVESVWELTLVEDGQRRVVRANAIISAAGLFGVARPLEVPGIEDFEGRIVHTTEWSEDVDLAGKRVAVIGNGSTGVQLLQSVAKESGHVTVFQRSPQWIINRAHYGEAIDDATQWLLKTMPYYWNWYIYSMLAEGLGNQVLQEPDAEWIANGGLVNEANDALRATMTAYTREQLGDREDLIDRVTPSHAPMARRLIVDNGWYRTLREDHVELVTAPIERMTSRGIRTTDEVDHEVDLVIAATGFATTKFLFPMRYTGLGGRTLEDAWAVDGPRAHLGMTVPGFPSLFIMYGPSAQPRSGSTISLIEQWVSYAVQAIVLTIEQGARRIDVRQEVFDAYNEALDAAAEKLIWVDKGAIERNYYVNEFGRSQVNEPWPVQQYYGMIRRPEPSDFVLT